MWTLPLFYLYNFYIILIIWLLYNHLDSTQPIHFYQLCQYCQPLLILLISTNTIHFLPMLLILANTSNLCQHDPSLPTLLKLSYLANNSKLRLNLICMVLILLFFLLISYLIIWTHDNHILAYHHHSNHVMHTSHIKSVLFTLLGHILGPWLVILKVFIWLKVTR